MGLRCSGAVVEVAVSVVVVGLQLLALAVLQGTTVGRTAHTPEQVASSPLRPSSSSSHNSSSNSREDNSRALVAVPVD